jgi:catechol 2,3-dioxygenase-like lactoylglutathione lyase family enzyme
MKTQLPPFQGIHHLKFPVADLDRSLRFYERALGARRIPEFDHVDPQGRLFAYILMVPNLGAPLELRLSAVLAERHRCFDPLTMTVDSRADLVAWIHYFDSVKVPHSPVLAGGVGWLIVFEDPDGRRLRFYTRESHGPELSPDFASPWVRES